MVEGVGEQQGIVAFLLQLPHVEVNHLLVGLVVKQDFYEELHAIVGHDGDAFVGLGDCDFRHGV